MRSITAIAAILLGCIAAASTASAQDRAARAKIPFGFYVSDRWVPAGTYTLTSESGSPNIITIRNADSTVSLLSAGHSKDQPSRPNALVFKKYGDQYFLHEISCSACGMNVEFSGSRRERLAPVREAMMVPATNVYLALTQDMRRSHLH